MNRDKYGQGLVEYALILVLIALVVIAVLTALGTTTSAIFNSITTALTPTEANLPPDCYGSLLLPYLIGLTGALSLLLKSPPNQTCSESSVQ